MPSNHALIKTRGKVHTSEASIFTLRCYRASFTTVRFPEPVSKIFYSMRGSSNIRRLVYAIESHLDEYEYYNFDPALADLTRTRKGRSKKESRLNTNRHVPAGHERKILTKYQNFDRKLKALP